MTEELQSRMPRALRDYWVRGEGAAKIRWGTSGSFDRCVRAMRGEGVRDPEGTCANLHHEATGKWPAEGKHGAGVQEFAAQEHTGAMIALIPSAADAQRLCLEGGEEMGQLHMTLAYLGDAAQWEQAERMEMGARIARAVGHMSPVRSEGFALSYFNPHNEAVDTALVYGASGEGLGYIRGRILAEMYEEYPDRIPEQHSPWVPHVTAAYTDDLDAHRGLVDRLGPITFDTVRLAFAGDHYDIPLRETVDLNALVASMGNYSPVTWHGPLAPIGTPTGDKRIFQPGALGYQTFPMPLRFQRKGMPGHEGAVVVGRILHAEESEWQGRPYIVGRGDWFNPDIIPEVTEAMALVEGGVSGPSVDLDSFAASVKEYAGKPVLSVHEGRVRGATLVSIPAFADLRLELQYPPEEPEDPEPTAAVDASGMADALVASGWTNAEITFTTLDTDLATLIINAAEFANVNDTGWKGAPVAPRDAEFDADDAVARIEDYAGVGTDSPDESKMRKMFLWIDPEGVPLDRAGYRLPWGDIIDGKPYLIYHAIYAAAALLEGGHGGLPNIPDPDKARLRSVISNIYAKLATEFGDPNVRASWDVASEKASKATKAEAMDIETFGTKYDGIHPPKAAFAQKVLGRKTKWTVVPKDGYNEVYGHLADWDTCHLGLQIGQPNVCVKPPRSKRGYKDFHISSILTAEGELVDVGKMTIDTFHGSTRRGLTAAQVRAHYEHTGTEAAVGRVYEDEFGPAFFGIQVPDNDPAMAQKLRRTPVSGHWHPINGHLELVAALGVNRPAYPIVAAATGEEEEMTQSETIVLFDGDVQTGLIAGATFTQEELAEQEADCGCEGADTEREQRIARLSGLDRIPTHEELRARQARLQAL